MKNRIRDFSLSLILIFLFSISILGQFFTGFHTWQDELQRDGLPLLNSMKDYLHSGHFISSVAENMESEFLQMALFVYLTVFLYQVGSAESRKPPEQQTAEDKNKDLKEKTYNYEKKKQNPLSWTLYEHSLTLSLLIIFIVSFLLHAYGSMKLINVQHFSQNLPAISYLDVFKENEFWFESFQNWQSEFFSIAIMGFLSIFLRQKGSPQSKKTYQSNWDTGT